MWNLLWTGWAGAAVPDVDTPLRTGAGAASDAAVVVGLEDYGFLPQVPGAARDARALYHALVYTRGVPLERVELLTGGNREQILAAVDRARDKLGPSGTLWVVYAGHGATRPDTGEWMLVGDDAKPDPAVFTARSVSASELGDDVVLVADACWAGRARDGSELVPGVRFAVPQQPTVGGRGARVVAAGPGQVSAPYTPADHGLFSYFFTGALRGWADGELDGQRDGTVTLREAHAYTARAIATVNPTGQQPSFTGADRPVVVARPEVLELGPDLGTLPKVGEVERAPALVASPTWVAPGAVFTPPAPLDLTYPVVFDRGTVTDARGNSYTLGAVAQSEMARAPVASAYRKYVANTTVSVYGASMLLTGGLYSGLMLGVGGATDTNLTTYSYVGMATAGVGGGLLAWTVATRPRAKQQLEDALNDRP
ncbi:MAG: hypothetical protein ABMA64_42185, partial [Myxococcota bacterium]